MKDSSPHDGFAVSRGFPGGSPRASSAIDCNCLGACRPLTCAPVSAEVFG
ncbi:TPA: hypothetical protein ACUT8Q_000242 [Pseudomonas aeruginosa]